MILGGCKLFYIIFMVVIGIHKIEDGVDLLFCFLVETGFVLVGLINLERSFVRELG